MDTNDKHRWSHFSENLSTTAIAFCRDCGQIQVRLPGLESHPVIYDAPPDYPPSCENCGATERPDRCSGGSRCMFPPYGRNEPSLNFTWERRGGVLVLLFPDAPVGELRYRPATEIEGALIERLGETKSAPYCDCPGWCLSKDRPKPVRCQGFQLPEGGENG